jgi:hypothetical protein
MKRGENGSINVSMESLGQISPFIVVGRNLIQFQNNPLHDIRRNRSWI